LKYLISIVGPTAIGKTNLAVEVAHRYNCDIISADSRQFYKEMSIGTAKPSPEDMDGITHHFVDFISVEQSFSAGKFEEEAVHRIKELHSSNPVVVMVGGSGLYINAVLNGIDPIPSNQAIREELSDTLEKKGIESLQIELLEKDPEHYHAMDINNPQRLIRALEVCRHTRNTYTSYRTKEIKVRPFEIIKIGLTANRDTIYDRINTRVDEMLKQGLLEEVKALQEVRHLNALQTVGYKELFEHLDGKTELQAAVENIKMNTRRFAKRQLTWFKKDNEIHWFDIEDRTSAVNFLKSLTD
jgi:tRNA dimethylallyltransferase